MQKFPGSIQTDPIVLHDISLNQGLAKGADSGGNMAGRAHRATVPDLRHRVPLEVA
jgi:hypothetical protein